MACETTILPSLVASPVAINALQWPLGFDISPENEISQIRFSITNNCTNKCKYCFVKKNKISMNNAVLNNTLDVLIKSYGKNKKITIFGGEPTLAFDVLKNLVRMAQRKAKLANKNIE